MNFQELEKRIHRNQYGIKDIPSKKNRVNIEHSTLKNAGDVLGPVIVEYMLKQKNIDPMKKVKRTKHLMTVGSIIGRGRFDTTVWGSGILKTVGDHRLERYKKVYHRKIDFRAVRGPYTREIVMKIGYECPEIYGDPAVLMPLIYSPVVDKEYNISVILHHRTIVVEKGSQEDGAISGNDYVFPIESDIIREKQIHFIDPKTEDYKGFIEEILKSRIVISSSLHGIILAESYGVPAIFLNRGMDDQQTKFYDWYSSTGRRLSECKSIEEALESSAPVLPDVSDLQKNLMDSFPYDLWEV